MTEQNTQNNPAQAGAQPGLQIAAQYIKDFSFENPHAPESLVGGWGQPETAVNIALRHQQLKDNAYECVLQLRIEAKKKGDDKKACFIIDLSYAALAILQNIPKENHQAVMMVEVPKLLFPFAREIVASAVAQGGFPPLFLTPISFEALYMAEMKRLQSEKGQSKAAS
jgi:preprotein translocase subunit SecB